MELKYTKQVNKHNKLSVGVRIKKVPQNVPYFGTFKFYYDLMNSLEVHILYLSYYFLMKVMAHDEVTHSNSEDIRAGVISSRAGEG